MNTITRMSRFPQSCSSTVYTDYASVKSPMFQGKPRYKEVEPTLEMNGFSLASPFEMKGKNVAMIRTPQEFTKLWVATGSPLGLEIFPAINFDQQAVVLVVQGASGSTQKLQRQEMVFDSKEKRLELTLNFSADLMIGLPVMGTSWYFAVVDKDQVQKTPTVTITA